MRISVRMCVHECIFVCACVYVYPCACVYSETSEERTPTGLRKSVRYWEVSAIGR